MICGICKFEIDKDECPNCSMDYAKITKETNEYGNGRSNSSNVDNNTSDTSVRNNDNINPSHYTKMAISPHEYNKKNKIPWNESQVIKYVSRWRDKNGLEDLYKAQWYLNDLIKDVENEHS